MPKCGFNKVGKKAGLQCSKCARIPDFIQSTGFHIPSRYLFVQIQQGKRQSNLWICSNLIIKTPERSY